MEEEGSLKPPFRFGLVCCGAVDNSKLLKEAVYRGAYPTLKNFRFLCRLNLKTVVSLVPEDKVTEDLRQFCADNNITHEVISSDDVTPVLDILTNVANLPAFVHCVNGGAQTGLVVMCLRKLQGWTIGAVEAERGRFDRKRDAVEKHVEFLSVYRYPGLDNWHAQGTVEAMVHPTWLVPVPWESSLITHISDDGEAPLDT